MAERLLTCLLIAAAASWPASPLRAQESGPDGPLSPSVQNEEPSGGDGRGQDIIVTGTRYRTALAGTVPQSEFDPSEIRALGQGSVGEILTSLSPQTRGSAGAEPIILLNGRRISGFSEVSSLPPEAVAKIEVLAEDVALRYGYGSGSRVVNIVLLPRFAASSAELEQSAATEGGRHSSRGGLNILRIRQSVRWNLDAQYQRESLLLESERSLAGDRDAIPFDTLGNIGPAPGSGEIDPALSVLAGRPVAIAGIPAQAAAGAVPSLQDFALAADRPNATDTRRYRSLLPDRERMAVNGTLSGFVLGDTSATLNLRAETTQSSSLLGLSAGTLLLPGQSVFTPFDATVSLYREFEDAGPLRRETNSRLGHAGLALNGAMDNWFWSFTANFDSTRSRSVTDHGVDIAALQARLDAQEPSLNPFGPLTSPALATNEKQVARASSRIGTAEVTAYGPLFTLPAGALATSLTATGQTIDFTSRATGLGPSDPFKLSRKRGSLQAAVEIPIASSAGGPSGLGTVSTNFSLSVSSLSDFETIRRFSSGVHWVPARPLVLTASYTDEDRAPSVELLGDPVASTPNYRLFDFSREASVTVDRIDGGTPGLAIGNRRLLKLGLLFRPLAKTDLSVRADYARIRESNMSGAFPAFTTELEPAFPERFRRDSDGRLLSVDTRPLNFTRGMREELRWGASYSSPIPFALARSGGGDGQIDVALFHNWVLRDRATLRADAPPLDFLDGSAAGSLGGRPRHQLEFQAGLYRKGLGARLGANIQSATALRSPIGSGGGNALSFGGLATANLRLFADFGQRPALVRRMPWLQDTRLSLSVTNLLNSRMSVRDRNGATPFSYQPAFLDPAGRTVSISLRKLFT